MRSCPRRRSVELGRAMRAVNLGLPVQRALNEMADRSGSDDLALVVTAINVQHELGGNLAQTLDIISETVRDRIRIKREIDLHLAAAPHRHHPGAAAGRTGRSFIL